MKYLVMDINRVSQFSFEQAYSKSWSVSANIRANCTSLEDVDWTDKILYLSNDKLSGYAINKNTKELTNVFSTVKGRGVTLVSDAISKGARNLDCFDGYLVQFYSNLGFKVVKRESNWTVGAPDVVYMSL